MSVTIELLKKHVIIPFLMIARLSVQGTGPALYIRYTIKSITLKTEPQRSI